MYFCQNGTTHHWQFETSSTIKSENLINLQLLFLDFENQHFGQLTSLSNNGL
jgi:hypothetical protein